MPNNTVTAPKGFLAAGLACGIKKSAGKDLALLGCPTGATAAAVFTTNKIVSPAVTVCRRHLKSRIIRAVVANSGNANTCTGTRGLQNAEQMCAEAAARLDITPQQVLVASTGIIGKQLPMPKVKTGIEKTAHHLASTQSAGLDFARAIMTTDTRPKYAAARIKIDGKVVTIAGAIKGAGMISPRMATTLCFITSDAGIAKPLLARAIKAAIGKSVNKLTVDAHQSTNDTAIILASALAGARISSPGPAFDKFCAALTHLCTDLAGQMARDAEGATRTFTVVVEGAATKADAARCARAVADYVLYKCAVHGKDPNWGRIVAAVGSCGAKLNPEKLACKIGPVTVLRNSAAVKFDRAKAHGVLAQPHHTVTINLAAGRFSDFCLGCDLSKEYVAINADYHT